MDVINEFVQKWNNAGKPDYNADDWNELTKNWTTDQCRILNIRLCDRNFRNQFGEGHSRAALKYLMLKRMKEDKHE